MEFLPNVISIIYWALFFLCLDPEVFFIVLWAGNKIVLDQKSAWSGSMVWLSSSLFSQEEFNSLGTMALTGKNTMPEFHSVLPFPHSSSSRKFCCGCCCFCPKKEGNLLFPTGRSWLKFLYLTPNPAGWTQLCWHKHFIVFYTYLLNDLTDFEILPFFMNWYWFLAIFMY